MEKITLQEWCELRLFMIADGYTSLQIKDEQSKYTIIDEQFIDAEPSYEFRSN